ncbi:MAG TPA: ferredoxin [Candidatus Norongarragalinales archaeon]|nr:ferredoxin [Candidatus Norongarragalinales archaeon]
MKDEIPFVDKAKCVGAGVCTAVAPNTFKLSGGKAILKKPFKRR